MTPEEYNKISADFKEWAESFNTKEKAIQLFKDIGVFDENGDIAYPYNKLFKD